MEKYLAQLKHWLYLCKTYVLPSRPSQLVIQTILKWQRDGCLDMGAALAYYALFSLFPICLVILSVAGKVLGSGSDYYDQLLTFAQGILPEGTFRVFEQAIINLGESSFSAGIIGFGLLILTASRIFDALNQSVDKIWHVVSKKQENPGVKHHAFNFIKNKIFSFLLLLSTVLLFVVAIFVDLIVKIILNVLINVDVSLGLVEFDRLLLINGLQMGVYYFIVTVVMLILFKLLPPVKLKWFDIFPGAVFTSAALMVLQNAVSSGIIRIGENFQAYGVVGNVMVLLLWIYLIFQVFFIGCEFTFVFTYIFGSRRHQPKPFGPAGTPP